MEEIIAKSKMYKELKMKQREDDEAELDKVTLHGEGAAQGNCHTARLFTCSLTTLFTTW
jgi:hypothetical protein